MRKPPNIQAWFLLLPRPLILPCLFGHRYLLSVLLSSFHSHYHCPGAGSHHFLVWTTLPPNYSPGFISLSSVYLPAILPKCESDHSLKSFRSSLKPTEQNSDSYVWYSRVLMIWTTLSYDLVTLDYSLFTEMCHTPSRLTPLVTLLLRHKLSLFILWGPEQIPSSVKSFLTPAPTEMLSWMFLKHFCSYLGYRAYCSALWWVGYVAVLLTLLGVLEDRVHTWFILVALLAASTMYIVGI